jgi:ribosome biogenesis GTPase A
MVVGSDSVLFDQFRRLTMTHIQWFPGHMHKARVQIKETLPKVQLVIEILDARIPYSSENPMLAELRGNKPCLKLLNKSDLADPDRTAAWQAYLEQQHGVSARAVTSSQPAQIRRLADVCRQMLPERVEAGKAITAMIVGIPNVGKSTLINKLAGKSVAKTGNEPAITRQQQTVRIGDSLFLLDTPGVLWPNVTNPQSGYRLAATGAVRDTAMDYADVGYFAAEYMLEHYPAPLVDRYSLEEMPTNNAELIEAIGRKRGCLNKRNIVDIDRASRIFLNELRTGMLGPVTFETPEVMERERIEVAAAIAEKESKKKTKKADRKARFRQRQKSNR